MKALAPTGSAAVEGDQHAASVRDSRFLRRVDWNLFRQFQAIGEAGSLTGAARRLNIQQPSLSAALRRLEGHLGLPLCRRTARGIELTPAGKALNDLCKEISDMVGAAPHLVSQAARQVDGTLSIYMISNVISAEFDQSLASFHGRHPSVEVGLTVAPWRAVLDAVSSGAADIGITYDSGPQPGFQYEALFAEAQQVYCGRSHQLYGQRVREVHLLAREAFVLTRNDEPEDLERFRRRYRLGTKSAATAEDLHEAARLIQLGIGVGFLPTLVGERIDLWPILHPSVLPTYLIYLVAPPATRIATPPQLFLDEVRRRLRARNPGGL